MAKALFAWVLYNVITQQSLVIFNTSNITDINQSLDLPIVLLNICPNYPLYEWGVSKITQDSAHTGPKRVFTKFFGLYTNATVSVKPCSTTLLKIANLAKTLHPLFPDSFFALNILQILHTYVIICLPLLDYKNHK